MDEWRIQQQQQQQQQRMISGGVGPIHNYHSIRSRSSPYSLPHQMTDLKQSYSYPQNPSGTPSNPLSPSTPTATTPNPNPSTTPIFTKSDSNDAPSSTSTSVEEVSTSTATPDVYNPTMANNPSYTPVPMESRMMPGKSSIGPIMGYHPGQQQMMAARSRSMPYPMPPPGPHHHHHHHPPMYPNAPGPVCQCAQHMHSNNGHYSMQPTPHPMYYQQQQQQQQQQQHEAWYRYQQQQQQAAWRQHQMQQQHLQSHSQPIPIEQNYNGILADSTSTNKLKAAKVKTKKKTPSTQSLNEEPLAKYQPVPPTSLNFSVQQQQQRACMPPSSATYYPSVYSNSYIPAQQLPPPPSSSTSITPEHPTYTQTSPTTLSHHQSQIFTSPLSNPGTPHQILNNGEFTSTAEFGVPYHHGAPGSVNSLTDALCPGTETTDRQMTPGPPSVGTPRVAPHQYSFPHTPLTPQTISNQSTNPHTPVMMPPTPNPLSAPPTPLTRPRSSGEQILNPYQQYEQNKSMNNVDALAAYLRDPTNVLFTDDVTSTLFDDIDALADTYLGPQPTNQVQTTADTNTAEAILLNFLCPDVSS